MPPVEIAVWWDDDEETAHIERWLGWIPTTDAQSGAAVEVDGDTGSVTVV